MTIKLIIFLLCWVALVLFDHTSCQLCVQLPVTDCSSSSCGATSSTQGAAEAPEKSAVHKRGKPDGRCPTVSYTFPGPDQITDYVRYRGYFPQLRSFHMCAWVRNLKDTECAVASYNVDGGDNELLWFEQSRQLRQLYMKRERKRDFHQSTRSNHETFVCMWYGSEGATAITRNVSDIDASGFEPRLQIQGGGSLVIGQEQDLMGLGFDASQSFRGTITNFMIWPRVLSDWEVHDIAYSCVCPPDYAVAMTMDRVEMHGDVTYTATQECPTL